MVRERHVFDMQISFRNEIDPLKVKLKAVSGYLHVFKICDSKSWHGGTINTNELSSIDEVFRETCLEVKGQNSI